MPTGLWPSALTRRRSAASSPRSSPTAPRSSSSLRSARVLLSDADRELLYEKLKRHAAEGRLSVEELERRVAVVALAQAREAAAAAMADLPPLPASADARPSGRPRWGRGHGDADK